MHSLASFAIFAFSGSAIFMIRATGAKLRMSASDPPSFLFNLEARRVFPTGEEESWGIARQFIRGTTPETEVFALQAQRVANWGHMRR